MKANPLFTGRLEILAKGEECVILVKDKTTGKPFVTCPVRYKGPPAYEATFDSSRYFVLRIENMKTKRHAFAGLGFNKRDQALDFKVALQDFSTQLDREKQGAALLAGPSKDLSIKPGEKIKINIKTRGAARPERKKPPAAAAAGGGSGLAGPTSTGGRRRRRNKKPGAPAQDQAETNDDLLSLGELGISGGAACGGERAKGDVGGAGFGDFGGAF